jgi:hypothetical protein
MLGHQALGQFAAQCGNDDCFAWHIQRDKSVNLHHILRE